VSRATFFKFHSWLGIVNGLFLLTIAWTGSLAVFKDEIDWLLTPAVRADANQPARPLDEIVAAVQTRYPDRRVAVHAPYGPHWSYTAFVYGDGSTRFLYIDPATATVAQDDEMRGYTWNAGYFVRQLHIRMLMGLWGRVLVGIFGVVLVLSVVTSLWIYRDWLRSLVRVRRDAGRRIFHMDLHKAVGLWSLAFNLMFGITGAVLGIENVYNQILRASARTNSPVSGPAPATAASTAPHVRLSRPSSLSETIAELTTADRSFTPTVFELTPASAPGKGTLIVRGDHPGALIAKDTSSYSIDLATGAIADAVDARRVGWWTYLYNVLDPLHFGYLGEGAGAAIGYVVKVIWALTGLAPGVLSITGGYMWWLRRQRSRAAAAAWQEIAPHRTTPSPVASPAALRRRPETWASGAGILLFVSAGLLAAGRDLAARLAAERDPLAALDHQAAVSDAARLAAHARRALDRPAGADAGRTSSRTTLRPASDDRGRGAGPVECGADRPRVPCRDARPELTRA
jgi:uncharacterized iron-regulated membrane protein